MNKIINRELRIRNKEIEKKRSEFHAQTQIEEAKAQWEMNLQALNERGDKIDELGDKR